MENHAVIQAIDTQSTPSPCAGLWTKSAPQKFLKADLPAPGTSCPYSAQNEYTLNSTYKHILHVLL